MSDDISVNQSVLDHAVIVVSDLYKAVENFRQLGFRVEYGGSTGPVHNALITFLDGTYIELVSVKKPLLGLMFRFLYSIGALRIIELAKPSLRNRFFYWFGTGKGLQDWCVRCADIDKQIDHLNKCNIDITRREFFSRKRPDKIIAEWTLIGPKDRQLPFFIQDITPIGIRVPQQNLCSHANEVTGISAIVIRDRGEAEANLSDLFSSENTIANFFRVEKSCFSEEQAKLNFKLELATTGELKGMLPMSLTSQSFIEII